MRLAFPWRRPRVPLHAGIIVAVVAMCLLLLGLDSWSTWQAGEAAVAADKTETANLARSLAQHASDTLHITDVILCGLRERVETDAPSEKRTARLERLIAMRLAGVPALSGLAVFDAAGAMLAGEHSTTGGAFTVADRAYFEYHRTHADRGMQVDDAILSRADGLWSITVSRRLDDPQGRFAGVVRGRISVAFLRDFYRSFAIGPRGLISLGSLSGVIIARSDLDAAGGSNVSAGPVFRKVAAGQLSGSFRYVSPLDGITRLGSFRRIEGSPLYIVVGHALDDVLAGWRANARLHLAVSLLVSGLVALAGRRFAGQVRTRQLAERRYRLLAENSSDAIVCIGLDGSRRYISPAFTALTGWSAEEGVCGRAGDIIHPDDREEHAQLVPRLLSGAAQVTSCFRFVCKDGSLLWVEARARLLQGVDGQTQVICNVRDISERRAAENQVAMLNLELAEQANTDGLTGLANRRCFDATLEQEWRRAARDETPLALLMIDVDRFKLYNDRYGHQQGDECLRTVATTMAQVARRPADLTARYGGEEFVVLLPGVDEAGAAAIAARMLAAIRATGIEHAANPPPGVVTASIGVASVLPRPGRAESSAATLIERADAALYQAKRTGRDRAATQGETAATPGAARPTAIPA